MSVDVIKNVSMPKGKTFEKGSQEGVSKRSLSTVESVHTEAFF